MRGRGKEGKCEGGMKGERGGGWEGAREGKGERGERMAARHSCDCGKHGGQTSTLLRTLAGSKVTEVLFH